MKSQNWTLIRRIAATTSFACLVMGQTALVPNAFGQQVFVSPATKASTSQQENSVKATIRLRTNEQQSPSDVEQYDFAPVPAINKQVDGVKRGLLDSRFNGFPKSEKANLAAPNQTQTGTNDTQVTPVAWDAPATAGGIFVPASTTISAPTPSMLPVQDQQPQGEVTQIDPDNPLFQGLKGTVKIIVDETTNKLTVIGDPADVMV